MIELIWFGSKTNLKKIADLDLNLYIGPDIIKPVNVVRDLGVYLDSELSMEHHISTVVRACFFHLRRLKSIRRILGADVTSGLVSVFVTTRMDYCNSILYADDTQLYISFTPSNSTSSLEILSNTFSDILSWMNSNKLLLNPSKTEFLLIGTKTTTAQIFSTHNFISRQ